MDKQPAFESSDGFLFPFEPYENQLEFMRQLNLTLTQGNIGLFESPTGTGKSLSLICGCLKWFKEYMSRKKVELLEKLNCEIKDENDWFSNYAIIKEKRDEKQNAKEELDFLEKRQEKINNCKKGKRLNVDKKLFAFRNNTSSNAMAMNNQSLPEDSAIVSDDFVLFQDLDEEEEVCSDSEEKLEREVMKIYYASRTHSQLLQFINEFKKTPYSNNVTITCLGSRSALCVNESVKKLKSFSLMNDKCSELLNSSKTSKKEKAKCGCPYYHRTNMKRLEEEILADVCDIEDLGRLGSELKACPYYTTRGSIRDVELIVLPYNILLHKPTRESYGIKLKDNIVIVDEAHNLIDAINNMYAADINSLCLFEAQKQLMSYASSYNSRFSAKTVLYIKQLQFVLSEWIKYFNVNSTTSGSDTIIMSHDEFLNATGINHMNVFELVRFCEDSHIGYKLFGFTSSSNIKAKHCASNPQVQTVKERNAIKTPIGHLLQEIAGTPNAVVKENKSSNATVTEILPSAFLNFFEFLQTLTLPEKCGKYVCVRTCQTNSPKVSSTMHFKFLHLNSSLHFQEIIKNVKSLILAGGTMQPIKEFVDQLLIPAGAERERIVYYSFGHVVPKENLLVMPLGSGPDNITLDFRYNTRETELVLHELGNIFVQLAEKVKGGLVCFFPSYSYEQLVHSYLHRQGFLSKIQLHKTVFREPRNYGSSESLLNNYAKEITSSRGKGAILFCVISGKMSEGINFSDDLCRCVVIVGLPYAKMTPEFKEKVSYSQRFYNNSETYCQTQCMKAVNQSIGRAIRHKDDYACILLLDVRYSQPVIQSYFPKWVSQNIIKVSFDSCLSRIETFFSAMGCKRSLSSSSYKLDLDKPVSFHHSNLY